MEKPHDVGTGGIEPALGAIETQELRTLYIQQRDKHLEQLMSINGRLAFGALAAVLAIALGVEDFQAVRVDIRNTPNIVLCVFGLGAFLLGFATWTISSHHSERIRSLEHKIVKPSRPVQVLEFQIIPPHAPRYPFQCIFFGLMLMAGGVITHLAMLPPGKSDDAKGATTCPTASSPVATRGSDSKGVASRAGLAPAD